MKRVLITGLSGFIGKRLALRLLNMGYEVYGIGFRRSIDELQEWFGLQWEKVNYEEVDILDPIAVESHFNSVHPDFVYHLAAQANLPTAKRNPYSTLQVNVLGSWNVAHAALMCGAKGIHLASSSDVYGPVPSILQPITEEHPLRGFNPYALSKLAMENIGRCFWETHEEFQVIVTRLFTTTGVGQYTDAAVSYFAWQAAKIKLGLQESVLKCGNIDNVRTFLDVDDVISAFILLPKVGRNDQFEDTIYNISGHECNLRDIVEQLQDVCGVDFEIADTGGRKNDITRQIGSSEKFNEITEWVPEIPFPKTVQKVYDYWIAKLGG